MKKFEFPQDLNFRLRIQPPSARSKKFRIIKFFIDRRDGSPTSETLEDSAIDAVNASLSIGKYSLEKAKEELDLLVERLYREAGVKKFQIVESEENLRLLKEFWNEYLESHRVKDQDSAFAKYRRAIEAVGILSLKVASKRELQTAVDKKATGNKQRAAVGRLHTILDWLKRSDVRLMLNEEEEGEVQYLTDAELKKVLDFIPSEAFKLACIVARGTGMRMGELLYMRRDQIKDNQRSVFIKYQLLRDGTKSLAKCRRADDPGRKAFVHEEARSHLEAWIDIKSEFSEDMRLSAANILRAACKKAFPKSPDKWVKFHDLRHSYAIDLAQAGVSLLQISQQLGNSERVCQKHYTGYMATDESVDMIERKMRAMKKSS